MGASTTYGARPLARLIQKEIKDPLAEEILFGKIVGGGSVFIGYDSQNNLLTFTYS